MSKYPVPRIVACKTYTAKNWSMRDNEVGRCNECKNTLKTFDMADWHACRLGASWLPPYWRYYFKLSRLPSGRLHMRKAAQQEVFGGECRKYRPIAGMLNRSKP